MRAALLNCRKMVFFLVYSFCYSLRYFGKCCMLVVLFFFYFGLVSPPRSFVPNTMRDANAFVLYIDFRVQWIELVY